MASLTQASNTRAAAARRQRQLARLHPMHLLQKVRRNRASGRVASNWAANNWRLVITACGASPHGRPRYQAIPRGLADPTVETGKHRKNARDGGPIRQQPMGGGAFTFSFVQHTKPRSVGVAHLADCFSVRVAMNFLSFPAVRQLARGCQRPALSHSSHLLRRWRFR